MNPLHHFCLLYFRDNVDNYLLFVSQSILLAQVGPILAPVPSRLCLYGYPNRRIDLWLVFLLLFHSGVVFLGMKQVCSLLLYVP